MTPTTVVNIRHSAYDQYIGRQGHGHDGYFGNPVPLPIWNDLEARARCLRDFKSYFLGRVATDPEFKSRVLALRGKRLGCFCAPLPCHGHVIAAWIDQQPIDVQPEESICQKQK